MLQPHQLRKDNNIQWIYNLSERLEKAFKKMVICYLPNISFTTASKICDKKPKKIQEKLSKKQLGDRKKKNKNRRFHSI